MSDKIILATLFSSRRGRSPKKLITTKLDEMDNLTLDTSRLFYAEVRNQDGTD